MTLGGFLVLALIAAVCGAIAQALVGYAMGGCVVSSVVGLIGALIGFWLARELGLPVIFSVVIQGQPFPIIWSIIGSTLFVAVMGVLSRRA
jgi:uncharacterized membrane protein YeaQ/YmgE (transglycosylase-associated protein family)